MRKNTAEVMEAWNFYKTKGKRGDSIWTDGNNVFSYDTCILTYGPNGGRLNTTKYSVTTTTHQNGIKAWLAERGVSLVEVPGILTVVPFTRGVNPGTINAARILNLNSPDSG